MAKIGKEMRIKIGKMSKNMNQEGIAKELRISKSGIQKFSRSFEALKAFWISQNVIMTLERCSTGYYRKCKSATKEDCKTNEELVRLFLFGVCRYN